MAEFFNIDTFVNKIKTSGFAVTNRFVLEIGRNDAQTSTQAVRESMKFKIKTAQIPGRDFDTTIYSYNNATPVRIMPSGLNNPNNLDIEVILSENYEEKDFFEQWMSEMVTITNEENGKYNYKFNYYDTYKRNCKLYVYGLDGEVKAKYEFVDCYPATVQDINLSWDDDTQPAILSVNINYFNYFKI